MKEHDSQIRPDDIRQFLLSKFSPIQLKQIPNEVLLQFKAFCVNSQLDPGLEHVHLIKFGGNTYKIFIGRQGLRILADRTGNYLPSISTKFEVNEKGEIVSATAFLRKYTKGEWHDVSHTVYLSDYQNSTNPSWKSSPRSMLDKTAEMQLLKKAFPDILRAFPDRILSVHEPIQNEPDQNEPDQNEPDQNEPDQNEPDQNEPDQNEPIRSNNK